MTIHMHQLHQNLKRYLRSIPSPTPRNLWLLIGAAVVTQNLAVFHTSQSPSTTVFAVLIWGGALICIEDQLEFLKPRPRFTGLLIGTILIFWIIARTAIILHWDGILFALAPLSGIALSFIYQPVRQIAKFRDPILCLMLLPAFPLLMRSLPEEPISLVTAKISGLWIGILGFDVFVKDRNLLLQGGGVQVLGACNGLDMMAQVFCVGVIFLLAFPIRARVAQILIIIAAPLIGLLSNTLRISLLALIVASGHGKGSFLFDFFHQDGGSLLFSGFSIFIFGLLYMHLIEKELSLNTSQLSLNTTNKDSD
jgi:cyanoexosortase A